MSPRIWIEPGAAALLEELHRAGYAAYVVGGCVRDSLLGLAPHDWDLCTSATPAQVTARFGERNCIPTGLSHGTVTVKRAGKLYEVTTFRTEGAYSDGRHPDQVHFVSDVRADLARRDFTINAMAYSDEEGLIDPFGGQRDLLEFRQVRAVGDPAARFEEDGLRILRLYRFAARFGFAIDPDTGRAARALRGRLACVSAERIQEELCKLLLAPRPGDWMGPELFAELLPELDPLGAPERFARVRRTVDAAPAELPVRLAALFCPLEEADRKAEQALRRLRCSNALTGETAALVRERALEPAPDGESLRRQARRLLGRLEPETLRRLTALRAAQQPGRADEFAALWRAAQALRQQNVCCRVGQLAVNGRDLLALGVPAGPAVGRTLAALLDQVVDGALPNERQALLDAARALLA